MDALAHEFAQMSSGEDWLMQPVLAGMCQYESYKTGTIDLADVARMNDALAISSYNRNVLTKG